MRSISELSESEQETVFRSFKTVGYLTESCLSACAIEIFGVTPHKLNPIGADIKYIKFHLYTLVSSITNVIAIAVSKELQLKFDDTFSKIVDIAKVDCATSAFNQSFVTKIPGFVPMHGQDILLYRALELEATKEKGISFFDIFFLHKQYSSLVNDFFIATNTGNEEAEFALNRLTSEFRHAFSPEKVMHNDLCFNSLNAQQHPDEYRYFVNEFERFMNDLPDFVYDPKYGASRYANKGFNYTCACGQVHSIDTCEAICDGGVAHFAVYRSPCMTSVVKVKSIGLLRVKGIEVVRILTERESLIDIVCEAVCSRKRLS